MDACIVVLECHPSWELSLDKPAVRGTYSPSSFCLLRLLETASFICLLLGLWLTLLPQWEASVGTLRCWPPVPGADGSGHMDSVCCSGRERDSWVLHPSVFETNTDWRESQYNAYRTAHKNVVAAHFLGHAGPIEGGTCTPHPSDFTSFSRED